MVGTDPSARIRVGWTDQETITILERLFAEAPEAMLVIDDEDRIVLATARVSALLGYSTSELPGRLASSILIDLYQRPMDAGDCVLVGRHESGGDLTLTMRRTAVTTSRGRFFIVSLRSTHESSKPREEDLAHAEERRLRGEFVGNMSHVLRTPLNSIIGFAKLMHHGKVGQVSERQREYLGDIANSGQHLLGLINDVLELSKIDAGVMEFRPEPIDVPQLIGEVREIVAAMAATRQLRIEVVVDADCTGFCLDRSKLKQVLFNLISHAIKRTERGRIDVRATVADRERWRLEVTDSGRLMAPDEIARALAQRDARHLGLVLTKRIVEAQGGTIGMHSQADGGTTVFALLPRQAQELVASTPQPATDF